MIWAYFMLVYLGVIAVLCIDNCDKLDEQVARINHNRFMRRLGFDSPYSLNDLSITNKEVNE